MPGYHAAEFIIGNTIYEQGPGGYAVWTIPPGGHDVAASAPERAIPLELVEAFRCWKREVHGTDPSIAASPIMSSSSESDDDHTSSATGSMPSPH